MITKIQNISNIVLLQKLYKPLLHFCEVRAIHKGPKISINVNRDTPFPLIVSGPLQPPIGPISSFNSSAVICVSWLLAPPPGTKLPNSL